MQQHMINVLQDEICEHLSAIKEILVTCIFAWNLRQPFNFHPLTKQPPRQWANDLMTRPKIPDPNPLKIDTNKCH